jgi:hypothetical protein
MDSLVVPGLDTLRQWLDELGISFFECDSCQALHLPHMQNFEGIFDAKLDLVDNVVLFSALAEVKPPRCCRSPPIFLRLTPVR